MACITVIHPCAYSDSNVSRFVPRTVISGWHERSILSFLGTSMLIFMVSPPIHLPIKSAEVSFLSPSILYALCDEQLFGSPPFTPPTFVAVHFINCHCAINSDIGFWAFYLFVLYCTCCVCMCAKLLWVSHSRAGRSGSLLWYVGSVVWSQVTGFDCKYLHLLCHPLDLQGSLIQLSFMTKDGKQFHVCLLDIYTSFGNH